MKDRPSDHPLQELRSLAERELRERLRASADLDGLEQSAVQRLVHELRVHQIELEMQNEELRRAQLDLEASRAEYFDLYDLAPVGYLTLDEHGLIKKANLTAARLLGVERARLIGIPLTAFISRDDQDGYYLKRKDLAKSGGHVALEVRLKGKDGAHIWARLEMAMGHDSRQDAPCCRVVIVDVTERRQAEESLAGAVLDLQEADRRKDYFLGVLSHEIRNPLASIMLCLSLLDRGEPGGGQATRALEIMRRQAGQLARIVNDLLDVTRITRGTVELHRETVDLCELVWRTAEDYRAAFREKGVDLVLDAMATGIQVEGDPTRLAQIVGNLLDNAAKFTDSGGVARLSVAKDDLGGRASIRLADSGVGMDPEILECLFDPFVQAGTSLDRKGAGLGLGLALVRGLAQLHGGTATAESEGRGKGSAFTVFLPISLGLRPAAEATATDALATPEHLRVLVIEDVEDMAENLRTLLEAEGLEVTVAHNGEEGIARAKESRPDVLLCDIGLPGLNGYEVARAFHADESLRNVYLIALTGYARPQDEEMAKEAGYHCHLAKPVDLQVLTTALAGLKRGGD